MGAGDHRFGGRQAMVAILVVGLIVVGVIYGPLLVSGNYHRATIERMATDAVGRQVSITGPIALSVFPDPQLRAKTITIGSPDGGLITADTLKLDLAPWPLLLGRLRATRLTLGKPYVALPWPLPGGARTLAPPPWLASLHATIADGTLRIGALRFDHVDLSIFTGGPNAVVAASGSVALGGVPATVTLDLDNTGARAPAPVTAAMTIADLRFGAAKDAKAPLSPARLAFKGTLDRASLLSGVLTGSLATAGSFRADVAADGAMIALHAMDARLDRFHVTGRAVMALRPAPMLRLDIDAAHGRLGAGGNLLARLDALVPVAASIGVRDLAYRGLVVSTARMVVRGRDGRVAVQSLAARLPGHGVLRFEGGPRGRRGEFSLTADDPARLFAGLGEAHLWPDGLGRLVVGGRMVRNDAGAIRFDRLRGAIGGTAARPRSPFSGAVSIMPGGAVARVAADIAFTHLVLNRRILAAVRGGTFGVAGSFDLTAGTVLLRDGAGARLIGSHLLIDGGVADAAAAAGVTVRLASLQVGRSLIVGHGGRRDDGAIVAMRLMMAGPDAAAALAALDELARGRQPSSQRPAWQRLTVFHHRFVASLAAAGAEAAVHTGMTLHLGAVRLAAMPVVDLDNDSAAGALSLHAPNAAVLLHDLGEAHWLGTISALDWPGPGSVSLRASAFVTGAKCGLSNFVLSLGGLTAAGRLAVTPWSDPVGISGAIAADSLPLPPVSRLLTLADAALARDVALALPVVRARRITLNGRIIMRRARLKLAVHHGKLAPSLTLGVDRAVVAGGVLNGALALTGAGAKAPPTLSIAGRIKQAALDKVTADLGVPTPFTGGLVNGKVDLTASGAGPVDWRRDLAGSVTGFGTNVTLRGVDLARAGAALAAATAATAPIGSVAAATLLRQALRGGTTGFASFTVTGAVKGGTINVGQAALTGAAGTMGATGTADLNSRQVALAVTARPMVAAHKSAPTVMLSVDGMLARPKIRPHVNAAIGWIEAHRAKTARPGVTP